MMFDRIKGELLDHDPSACLPRNLSDEWLSYLAISAEKMLGNDDGEHATVHKEAALAVVIRLLDAKSEGRAEEFEVPIDDLYEYLQRFRMELALEEVHRKTDVKYNAASLESILTERDIETWKDGDR
ncbi:hypothetical protein [Paraburkholderia fungorum]|uniref:hypothetical protein n=1 Tax=Paraburkholderia fungorum TaxID=134537 RepID=UPI001C1EFC45|nr:hypothetical protein [Paraburkholderia fungorum]MBU7437008.1 hypothetical protein [Paraburkholderia fungorum]